MSLILSATSLYDGGGDPFELWQPSTVSGFVLDINPHFKLTTGLDGARVTASQIVNNAPSTSDAFANSNPSLQPTYEPNGWGGTFRRPSLLFDGIAYYLICTTSLASTLMGGLNTPFTLFMVGQFVSLSGGLTANCPLFMGSSSSVTPLWDFFAVSSTWKSNKRGDSGGIVGISGGTADTTKHLFDFVQSGTTVAGAVDTSSVLSGSQTTVAATVDRMALGATYANSSPSDWANFRLARLLGFTGALAGSDITAIRSQLTAMYF